jgi:hypothetical protein
MNRNVWLLGILIIAIGAWMQYERQTDPATENRRYMFCETARTCVAYIERSYRTDLSTGTTDFSAVRSEGTVVTVEYDLQSVRADFSGGLVEDGRTLERWADDELVKGRRDEACQKLDHREFIRMGGTMEHSYRFSDGEVLRNVVVAACPGV